MSANIKNLGSRSEYNDAYDTCAATCATFRAYTGDVEPDAVSRVLGMKPTGSVTQGKMIVTGPSKGKISKLNGWFLSTKGQVDSKDLRRHLDWLLEALAGAPWRALNSSRHAECHYGCLVLPAFEVWAFGTHALSEADAHVVPVEPRNLVRLLLAGTWD